jgi:hypothetical protein
MLFRVLKLFGIDVPAQIEAVKSNIAQRVEDASERVKSAAQQAGLIAALYAVAGVALGVTVAMGLVALYVWVASLYGVYAGLGAVGGLLLLVAIILVAVASSKSKAFAASSAGPAPRPAVSAQTASAPTLQAAPETVAAQVAVEDSATPQLLPPPRINAADLIEPLTLLLSKYLKFPRLGNPMLDAMLTDLRSSANVSAQEAVGRAAEVVRTGDRLNLLVVLSGATLAGWFLGRQARQH